MQLGDVIDLKSGGNFAASVRGFAIPMRFTALLPSVLFATVLASSGCSTHRTAHRLPPTNPMAERAAFIDRRAGELVRRGAPRDQAVTAASGEWEDLLLTKENRTEEEKRFAQRKLEADLAKMARSADR
ncbi:MAG: hypothetical protein NTV51_25050 [Verrucomicrobia bacterium]|nr:hypothetical protein [Verrucomicrobiota bacterium]